MNKPHNITKEKTCTERVYGSSLLEEWPHVMTNSSYQKKVSFSTYSNMKMYQITEFESYSSLERKACQLQAHNDAARIQTLMQSCPYEGLNAIRYLLDQNIVQPEELLGIEHLITGSRRISKERHKHVMMVLKAQNELMTANAMARIAVERSFKATKKAQLRAALATM
jgi:hypothetical protein